MPAALQDIAHGVLLATFAADAIGARWEGAPAVDRTAARQRLAQSLQAELLTYTDDTQLTLALAEHLCDDPAVDPERLAAAFLDHFEPHRGYARGMFGIVDAWRRGVDAADAATTVFPDGSFGNGAAMRVAPVGVVWGADAQRLREAARRQAALTHAHPVGLDAATVQARAVALAHIKGRFDRAALESLADEAATDALRATLDAARRTPAGMDLPVVAKTIGTGVLADQSVAAALWVAAVADDLVEAVVLALGLGGDVDTIAAMAGAVLGAAHGAAAVPEAWVVKLEDGRRGRGYATALAGRLATTAEQVRRSASARRSTEPAPDPASTPHRSG